MQSESGKQVLFLDRDGVVNEDTHYLHTIDEISYVDGIEDLILRFARKGFLIAIVTNQSGIGRGFFSVDAFHIVMNHMICHLKKYCGELDILVAFCPHHPNENCDCRKPKSGLFFRIQNTLNEEIDWDNSYMIGDNISDIIASENAGVRNNFLFCSDNNLSVPKQSNACLITHLNQVNVKPRLK